MATYTSSVKAPTGSVNVRAYKASRFAPYSGQPQFPALGAAAPANPDVPDVAVTVGSYSSVTLPTQEPYVICFVDGSSKVVYDLLVQYHAQRPVQGLQVGSGNGAPSATVGTPTEAMIYAQLDGAAGARLWLYMPATGWIAVAGF